ncbi:MAG: type III PLP-dependent enzyme [Alphaproteobacteria bacterium]|nr:type III PLP-dependent enzyme [Alphaproteobacteria bacterium]
MPFSAHAVPARNAEALPCYRSVAALIEKFRPTLPVYALFPDAFKSVAQIFIDGFPGETMYAVKANNALPVLDHIYGAGIRHFDVASLAEVRLTRERYPDAKLSFMAPVRIRGAAGEAFRKYGVRDFALDSEDELTTILQETGAANDKSVAATLTLYVRLYVPADGALLELSSKFGASVSGAATLLQDIKAAGAKPGLTFHVGSQCLHPSSFKTALKRCGETIQQAGVELAALDVGGGFPGYYQNVTVPPLGEFFAAIRQGIAALRLPKSCAVYCEPGRALCADGLSVVTQISLRRDHTIYINDGIYGSLNEYALKNWPVRYPLAAYTSAPNGRIAERKGKTVPLKAFGPTCDTLDVLHYLIDLPEDVAAGDWIEFQKLGAYSCSLRTAFNGFYPDTFVEISGPAPGETPL